MPPNILRRPLNTQNDDLSTEERSSKRHKISSSLPREVPLKVLTFLIVGTERHIQVPSTHHLCGLFTILCMEGHFEGEACNYKWEVMDMFTEEIFKYDPSNGFLMVRTVQIGVLEAASRIGDLRLDNGHEIRTLRLVSTKDVTGFEPAPLIPTSIQQAPEFAIFVRYELTDSLPIKPDAKAHFTRNKNIVPKNSSSLHEWPMPWPGLKC